MIFEGIPNAARNYFNGSRMLIPWSGVQTEKIIPTFLFSLLYLSLLSLLCPLSALSALPISISTRGPLASSPPHFLKFTVFYTR